MTDRYHSGLEAVLDIIGGKWKPLILRSLKDGPLRFGEIRRIVVGVSEKVLIQQLRDLVNDGVLERKDYREVPPKVDYSLTEFGWSLLGAIGPLCDWGSANMERIGKIKETTKSPD